MARSVATRRRGKGRQSHSLSVRVCTGIEEDSDDHCPLTSLSRSTHEGEKEIKTTPIYGVVLYQRSLYLHPLPRRRHECWNF